MAANKQMILCKGTFCGCANKGHVCLNMEGSFSACRVQEDGMFVDIAKCEWYDAQMEIPKYFRCARVSEQSTLKITLRDTEEKHQMSLDW